ncbi:Blue copper protein [Apostasia shenzhenica]|uniref:Blue copper protein n=1 Tax=Apostasia shenzhenica TaxID=1088818 RepID=A0A2I0ATN1_9ASPA|nr:Blue copper protein [Apostasia shenzhenica]
MERSLLIVFLLVAAAAPPPPPALATDYTVGDSQGWSTNVDYGSWASGKPFKAGDTLEFQYSSLHSVAEVTKSDYDSCSTGGALKTYSDQNTKIALTAAGDRYFICGTPGHCSGGMKLAVTVAASGSSPSTPSTPATPPTGGGTGSSPSPPAGTTKSPPVGNNGAGAGCGSGWVRGAAVLVGLGLVMG